MIMMSVNFKEQRTTLDISNRHDKQVFHFLLKTLHLQRKMSIYHYKLERFEKKSGKLLSWRFVVSRVVRCSLKFTGIITIV